MDKKKEEFLARLRETFRIEAGEHLAAITTDILSLERAAGAERAAIVERAFRETHSLKGAARSVSLRDVEALCQELETIFSAMKREELEPTTITLDILHSSLGVLKLMCEIPGAASPPGRRKEEQDALAALARILQPAAGGDPGAHETVRASEQAAARIPTLTAVATASKESGAPGPSSPPVAASAPMADTIRVSTQKLGAILLETEELVGARIAARGRAAELRTLVLDLAGWNQRSVRQASRRRREARSNGAFSDLLEHELFHAKALEYSLRKLAAAAQADALSFATITDRLIEDTKKLLLLPCSYILGALPVVLRDLSREQGKEAELVVQGEDIEIDRRVLDELKDPLIHLLRNCVDHGIEKPEARLKAGKPSRGSITIAAKAVEGNRVEFTVADDGSGIDVGKVRQAAVRLGLVAADEAPGSVESDALGLIFGSGLSTSPIITDLSGRGLGLAIVREKIEKLGGTISVTSNPGLGTSFRLLVPLSLATFRGVMVGVAGRNFVVPTANVMRVLRVGSDEITTIENRRTMALDGRALSFVRLRDVLELAEPDEPSAARLRPVVVLRAADREAAFLVDDILGEQEVMVKNLGRQLLRVRTISGATISDRGVVVPILNVADLLESAGSARQPEIRHHEAVERRGRLLIAEDSITARTLLKSILESAGYDVIAAVDGVDALTKLRTESFDLVVSDVDMPRMNGFELTAKIRADGKLGELPVVLVTALGSQKDREYGIEVGANAYIVKSDFDQGNLLEILRRLL
ncbi:MAG TPA: response regulator [Rectinemataceae bacterium]|nr:response regulator [Rectinemataceae bacterium]